MKRRTFFKSFGAVAGIFALSQSKAWFNLLMLKKKPVVSGSVFNLTLSSNTLKYNPHTAAGSPAGVCTINLTINSGVYVWSDVRTEPAIDFGFFLASGSIINIVNNGYIMGMGGTGGGYNSSAIAPLSGGSAIIIRTSVSSCTINSQTGYILGGGGGGGTTSVAGGGGGAGGGNGGNITNGNTVTGGTGGAVGASGADGTLNVSVCSGGGGGRVVPSTTLTGITSTTGAFAGQGGTGGGSGAGVSTKSASTIGGSGGGAGLAGGNGSATGGSNAAGGGGGGYGAKGGDGYSANAFYQAGASGGNAIVLNGNSVTWVGGLGANQVYGTIS